MAVFPDTGLMGTDVSQRGREVGICHSVWGQGGHRGPSSGQKGRRLGKRVPKHISLVVMGYTELLTPSRLTSQPTELALAWAHEAEMVPRSAQMGQLYPEVLKPGSVHLERGLLSLLSSPVLTCSEQVRRGETNGSCTVWRGGAWTRHSGSLSDPQDHRQSGGLVLQNRPQRIHVIWGSRCQRE